MQRAVHLSYSIFGACSIWVPKGTKLSLNWGVRHVEFIPVGLDRPQWLLISAVMVPFLVRLLSWGISLGWFYFLAEIFSKVLLGDTNTLVFDFWGAAEFCSVPHV